MREPFWRDPVPVPLPVGKATTLAHLGGATEADFTRSDTRALFLAITAALAAGARTKQAVLDALPPAMRAHAEWIEATGAEQFARIDALGPQEVQRVASESVTALRVLNARRELADLAEEQRDGPADPVLGRRVGELASFLGRATKAYPRADGIARSAAGREGAGRTAVEPSRG